MTTATFERQAELLETIHGCARELRELVGDSLVITIEPAKTNGAARRLTLERSPVALAVLELLADGEWWAVRDIAEKVEKKRDYISGVCARLQSAGRLEHNGEKTRASRYRLTSDAPEVEQGPADDEPAADDKPVEPILPPAAAMPSSLSQRTRKSIERAEAAQQNGGGQAADLPEVHEHVLRSLRDEAGTITELAMRTGLPRRDVAQAIEQLREAGRILECGIRPPRGHKVYGVAE